MRYRVPYWKLGMTTPTFSVRTQIPQSPNGLTVSLAALRAAGAPILDLTLSNPTRAGIFDDESWVTHLARSQSATYEPAPLGLKSARSAVARYLRQKGIVADVEQIVLCASTSEAYSYLFKLLTDPGDTVLFPRPSYPLLEHLATLENVRLSHYNIRYDGAYYIDTDSVKRGLSGSCKAIVLVSPNNPTGSCTSDQELETLAASGVPLISDEVFADFPLRPSQGPISTVLSAQSSLAFSLGGLSKTAGLPQLKLGWIVVGGPERIRREAVARLELICDTFLSLNTPVQVALPELLEHSTQRRARIQERLLHNYQLLEQRVRDTPVSLRATQGGWSAVLQLPNLALEDWSLHLLTQANLLVQPGWFYDDSQEGIVVVSLLTPEHEFSEGLERLVSAAKR